MLEPRDIALIEESIQQQADGYRDRWLSSKLSLYSSFLTLSGLALAAAALFAQSPASRTVAASVIFLSAISALFVLVQYHWLIQLYDALGFSKVSFNNERDVDEYHKRQAAHHSKFRTRRPFRIFLDGALYVIGIIQICLLGVAVCLL